MTRTLSRLALGLGFTAALMGTCMPALTQTADATAPADGLAMGVPDGIPDRTSAAMNSVYLAVSFDAWQQRCMKKEDGADPCELYQLLKDETGNAVAEIRFFTLPEGSQAAVGANIIAPLETLLTANLRIGIDAGTQKIYPFSYCNVNGCVAKVGFTAEELAVMKAGTEGVMTVVPAAAPEKTIAIKIALAGLTAGHQALVDAAAKIKN